MSLHRAELDSLTPFFSETAVGTGRYVLVALNPTDVPAMVALQLRTGTDWVVPRNADYYRTHFANDHTAIGFVDSNATLIAHALVRTEGHTTTMMNVLVDPLHRGQQLQKQMIRQWLEAAATAGITTAAARVRLGNDASLKNFDGAGLIICATEPSPEEPGVMTYMMKKSLQQTTVRNLELRPSA